MKDSAKTTKHDSGRNNRDGQAAKKKAASKSIKKGHAVKTDVYDHKNDSTLVADQNRQLELKLQLARVRLMQQRLEIQTKEGKKKPGSRRREMNTMHVTQATMGDRGGIATTATVGGGARITIRKTTSRRPEAK